MNFKKLMNFKKSMDSKKLILYSSVFAIQGLSNAVIPSSQSLQEVTVETLLSQTFFFQDILLELF